MSEEMFEKVFVAIEAMAEKLGVASEYLWEVLMRQVYVQFLQDVFFLVFTTAVIIFTAYSAKYVNKNWRKWGKPYAERRFDDPPAHIVSVVILSLLGILSLILLAVSVSTVSNIIGYVVNPEYYALEMILKVIK